MDTFKGHPTCDTCGGIIASEPVYHGRFRFAPCDCVKKVDVTVNGVTYETVTETVTQKVDKEAMRLRVLYENQDKTEPRYEYRYDSPWAEYIRTPFIAFSQSQLQKDLDQFYAKHGPRTSNLDQHFNDLRSNK